MKRTALLTVLVMIMAIMVGCGDKPEATFTPTPDAGPTATPTEAPIPSRPLVYSKQETVQNTEIVPFKVTLEAEDATLAGKLSTATNRKGYSGTGYVTNFNQNKENKLVIKVDIPTSQTYNITARAAADQHKINYVTVNGKRVGEIDNDGVKSKEFTDYVLAGIYIEAGTIELSIEESWGWFDLDSFTIEAGSAISPEVYNGISSALVNPNANEDAVKLMEYLVSIYGNHTLAGQYCEHNTSREIDVIYNTTGKYPAVRGFDMIFCSPNSGYSNLGEINQAKKWAKQGGIVSFSWHWHGSTGAHEFYSDKTKFRIPEARTKEDYSLTSVDELKALYQEGKLTESQYKLLTDIDTIAFHLKALQTAGIPVLWRPLHEASGGWFWWGATGADDYIWLWKLLFNRLTYYHELNNLIWVWNAQNADWYPGDDYVDIVGEDIYADSFDYGSQASKFSTVDKYTAAKKLVTLSENGVIMDPDLCIRDNVHWLWFNVWNGDFIINGANTSQKYTSDEILKKCYNSDYVITLDELPWNK